jgi:hypothetical protein
MAEYPKSIEEFEAMFPTDAACRDYLCQIRWPNGFCCPRCGDEKTYPIGSVLYQCAKCRYRMSVIAGTFFQDTHKPLTLWFRAIWWITGQKNGVRVLGLKRIFGMGSYQPAWSWLHKMRTARWHFSCGEPFMWSLQDAINNRLKGGKGHEYEITPDGHQCRKVQHPQQGGRQAPEAACRQHSRFADLYIPAGIDAMTDLESIRLMEERYGIREEGIF